MSDSNPADSHDKPIDASQGAKPFQVLSAPDPDQTTIDEGDRETKPDVSSVISVKLDNLGPMVVNSDGTLSRIANWPNLTEPERERTVRVLSTRNKIRIANEERKQRKNEGAGTESE